MSSFQLHQLVRLKGLKYAAYNGKIARVHIFPSNEFCRNGRYRIKLLDIVAPPLQQFIDIKPENMDHVCQRCLKSGENLLYCGKCKCTRYCDRECQRIDWERHKKECDSCGLGRDLSKNPLIPAVVNGDFGLVRQMIQEGIDVDMASHTTNRTALYVAAEYGHLDILQYLLQKGADKDKTTKKGATALHVAVMMGHFDVVQYLLDHGADIMKTMNEGITLLHLATYRGHAEVVSCLMRFGASLTARDCDGMLPIDVAGTEEIKQLIRDEETRRFRLTTTVSNKGHPSDKEKENS